MKKSRTPSPPRLAQRIFQWWAGSADTEDLLGDLDEQFVYNLQTKGRRRSQWIYSLQVCSLLFSYALRKRKRAASYSTYYPNNSMAMLQNYFKIAIRNFQKQKLFTVINIVGLALGMSICLLALSMFVSIFRFDEFHTQKDRIFQVNTRIADRNQKDLYASTFNAVGDYMGEKYPFIEQVIKIKSGFNPEIHHQGNLMSFHGYFAGSSFFETFSFPLISGNPATALAEPFSIVLTKSMAETLFRDTNPMGKTLETATGTYRVTGVMADLKQTHFYFQVLTSHQTYEILHAGTNLQSDWKTYRNNYVYLLLKPNTSPEALSDALAQVSARASEFNPDRSIILESTKLARIIPSWSISNGLGVGWDLPTMIFFMALGLLILMPAIFNYTNLSVARALRRAKEIGIRKVVGAEKNQIRAQFVVETILLTFLALIGSIFIFKLIQTEFLTMIIGADSLDTSLSLSVLAVFILFSLIIGIVAGIFPAMYFSRLNPVHTIKGEIKSRSGGVSGIRKGLFVFQFFVSLVFVIGVGAITKQYAYVLNYNHGFQSDNILAVPFQNIDKQVVINEFKTHPDVKAVTAASNLPGLPLPIMVDITPNEIDTLTVHQVFIGEDFIENMGMTLTWGESGNQQRSTRNEELVLVNEQFLRSTAVFGAQQDSLVFSLSDGTRCRIVGALKDFNFEPLNELIQPLVFRYSLAESNFALLTVHSKDIKKTINDLDAIWTGIDQKASFEASFLDDKIEQAYYFLVIQIKIFGFLSALAIVISCLGLLGMVSYTTENRTKEIAIRKIMGASNNSLYYTLTKDFVKLILIAAVIAIPFSYFFYDMVLLRIFLSYSDGLGLPEMVLSIAFLFLVGFAAIYWQTFRVTRENPASNLRHE
ncbi:ABC transporter permease [Marinoscillum luteum]|uniref:ABC transporter permease n=1 Tax=Marinoscillum luteum TaxID=861051 RepID=A0ABW7N7X8_9BACT